MTPILTAELTQGRRTADVLRGAGLLRGPFEDAALASELAATTPRPLDASLLEAWQEWLVSVGAPETVRRRLRSAREGAWMVVTGQQAGLFLGPWYTLAKAATAIRTARALEVRTGRPVIPVFWIADDDHDLGEIQHTSLLDAQGRLHRLRVPLDATRAAVCTLRVPVSAAMLLDQVLELTELEADEHFVPAFAPHVGESWTQWFVRCLCSVFGDAGLVPIVPALLTGPARPTFERALTESQTFDRLLDQGAEAVRATGLEAPLRADGDPPVFRIDADTRVRLRAAELGPAALPSLLPLARAEIPRLSANAALRVLVQNSLLPVAAYVAGPAELRYWAELGPLHDHFGIRFPSVLPRAEITVLSVQTLRHLRKLGIRPEDARSRLEEWRNRPAGDSPLLQRGRSLRQELGEWMAELGAGPQRKVGQVERSLDALLAALEETERSGSESALARWEALATALFPRLQPQERVLGPLPDLLRAGPSLPRQLTELPEESLSHPTLLPLGEVTP